MHKPNATQMLTHQMVDEKAQEAADQLIDVITEFNQKYSYPEVKPTFNAEDQRTRSAFIRAATQFLFSKCIIVPENTLNEAIRKRNVRF